MAEHIPSAKPIDSKSEESIESSNVTAISGSEKLNELDDECEYEEYEVDEEDDDEQEQQKTIIMKNDNEILDQKKQTSNTDDKKVLDEEEYEDEEVEYECEEYEDEEEEFKNKINELLKKTNDLQKESSQNKSEIENKFSNIEIGSEKEKKEYKVVYEDEDDDILDNCAKTTNLAQLKHASNKWDISELNDDEYAFNSDKAQMDSDESEYETTKNPIIQQKLDIQKAIFANKNRKVMFEDFVDDEEEIGEIEIALEENFIKEVEEEDEEEEEEEEEESGKKFVLDNYLSKYDQSDQLFSNKRPASPSSLILHQLRDMIINRQFEPLVKLLDSMPNFFIDAILKSGWTALMFSSYFSYPEMVELCLKRGADPNYNYEYFTPLLAASASRSNDERQILYCMQMLLERGARINDADKSGCVPLHHVARLGRSQLVKYLCQNGTDVNRIDHSCSTALHYAVAENKINVVKTLLEQKQISMDIKNKDGLTPIQLAESRNNQEIANVLHAKRGTDDNEKIPGQNISFSVEPEFNQSNSSITNKCQTNAEKLQKEFVQEFVKNVIEIASAEVIEKMKDDRRKSSESLSTEKNVEDIVPEFLPNTQVIDLSKKYSIDLSNMEHGLEQQFERRNIWQNIIGHLILTFFVYILYKIVFKLIFG